MQLNVQQWAGGTRTALLVHGLFSDSNCWHRVAPALLSRGYRVLAPDLRGHGHSERGRYSPMDWAMDLVDTFHGLPVDLAIGHSLGGLALSVAQHALPVQRAVFLDPAWRMGPELSARFLAEWSRWLQWTNPEQLRQTLGPGWSDEDIALRWASMWLADAAVIPGLAVAGGYDYSPELAAVPTLVLAADPSQYITDDHAQDLRGRGVSVRVVAGSGHSWFREDLPGFITQLDGWLRDTEGRAHTTQRKPAWALPA